MREANIKQENEKNILERIDTFLRNIDFSYMDDHNKNISIIIKNLSEAYKNLKESE